MNSLYPKRVKKANGKCGFTLIEVIVSLAVLAVIITLIMVAVGRFAIMAYLTRSNDTAEEVYMSLQSALTDLKTQGRFDEVFSEDKRGANGDDPQAGEMFFNIPEMAIDGAVFGDGSVVPGVTDAQGESIPDDERQALIDSGNLVYMRLDLDDTNPNSDSALFRDLVYPFIADKSILNYSLIAEINLNNKTVRSVFYTEKVGHLTYALDSETSGALLNQNNVLLRDRSQLDQKLQGYYGSLSIGDREEIDQLNDANVIVYNDDILALEWDAVMAMHSGSMTEAEKQKLLKNTVYDISIVNANNISKVYYKIKNVSAFTGASDASVAADSTKIFASGTSGSPKLPMPIYDIFNYDQVSNIQNKDLKVPFETEELQPNGSVRTINDFKHRFSYYQPGNSGGEEQPGKYRLVLDSLTTPGDDDLSIKKSYPALPWNEDFKVIVEARNRGEGLTGSINMAPGQHNAYTKNKVITASMTEPYSSSGVRGVNIFREVFNYLFGKTAPTAQNVWYEVAYNRHLNNLHYIVGDTDATKKGSQQNFLLTGNMDWSILRLGFLPGESLTDPADDMHQLTVSNVSGNDLRVRDTDKLRVFAPLSVGADDTGSIGFSGMLQSDILRDADGEIIYKTDAGGNPVLDIEGYKLPLFNSYSISNLKIATLDSSRNPVATDNVGLFEQVSTLGEIKNVTLRGAAVSGIENVGALAGKFFGKAENVTVLANTQDNYHKKVIYNSSGEASEAVITGTVIKPYDYPAGNLFEGNTIKATANNSGGAFGLLAGGDVSITPKTPGTIINAANGTIFISGYSTRATNEKTNGLTVKGQKNVGGIVGLAAPKSSITQVANAGGVIAQESAAGGVVGYLGSDSKLSGLDVNALSSKEQYVVRKERVSVGGVTQEIEYKNEFTNYGYVVANKQAGGVVGFAEKVELSNLANCGPVEAKTELAGGILALSPYDTTITNAINKADVAVTAKIGNDYTGSYAGGIIGLLQKGTKLVGVQNIKHELTNSRIPDTPVGISSGYFAGGIAGVAKDSSSILPLKFTTTIGAVNSGSWVTIENSSAVTARGKDSLTPNGGAFAGGIAGALTDEASINALPEGSERVITKNQGIVLAENGSFAGGIAGLIDSEKVRVYDSFNTGNITASANYAGGLVGNINKNLSGGTEYILNISDSILNGYVVPDNTGADVHFLNEGQVKADNYAGGIVGSTVTSIQNAFNKGSVSARQQYAGGVAGAAVYGSGREIVIGYDNPVASKIIARSSSTVLKQIYANQGVILAGSDNAGGIVGLAQGQNSQPVKIIDAFNATAGTVTANNNAGGLVGAGIFAQISNEEDISGAAIAKVLGNNQAVVTANVDNAGGIIGIGEQVEITDGLNKGAITAQRDNAGGVAGCFLQGTVFSRESTGSKLINSSMKNNTGTILAKQDNAGGVVGVADNSKITDTFNSGTTTSNRDNAGGLVGQALNSTSILHTENVGLQIITTKTASNTATITSTRHNSGGSVGLASESKMENLFNKGTIKSGQDNGGGIVGSLLDQSELNYTSTIAEAMVDGDYYSNSATVTTGTSGGVIGDNAGGVVGVSSESTITDAFNRGAVKAGRSNAGGIVGYMMELSFVSNRPATAQKFLSMGRLSNSANVTATSFNAGGVVGKMIGSKSSLSDVYSGDGSKKTASTAVQIKSQYNAGGVVGRIIDGQVSYAASIDAALNNQVYTNNASVSVTGSNAGGIIGNAADRDWDDNYSISPTMVTGSGLRKNNFNVSGVSNIGTVYTAANNAGGIFGVAGYGMYVNDPAKVALMIEKGMTTNAGTITASNRNAGGIFGYVVEKFERADVKAAANSRLDQGEWGDVLDVFNSGVIKAVYNAGGIAGRAIKLDLRYTASTLKDAVKAEDKANFIFSNSNSVQATGDNSGGIIGEAVNCILQDVFNSGNPLGLDEAMNRDSQIRISATNDNAGGIVGKANGLSLFYSDYIKERILTDREFVYSNISNVQARNNAGGIVGASVNGLQLVDVYNRGRVRANTGNAGGIVGSITENGNTTITDIDNLLSGIELADNKPVERFSNEGIDDIRFNKSVSYITYTTITSDPSWTTNRYTNAPKPATILGNFESNVETGSSDNAGGIVGYLLASYPYSTRLENVFNAGAFKDDGTPIAGVRAYRNNAGGLVGYSRYGNVSYSLPINPGPSNLDTGNKGDHSTFAQAFNDPAVRNDPYAVSVDGLLGSSQLVALHMLPNTAKVKASRVAEGSLPGNLANVDFSSGAQTNLSVYDRNAGSAIGYMFSGSINRAYSLQGEVYAAENVGGVVGWAGQAAVIKQVSRLDGQDIKAGTTLTANGSAVLQRGSRYVGGIVGFADSAQIMDVRNFSNVSGRNSVGGIVGFARYGASIILAQNSGKVTGYRLEADEVIAKTGESRTAVLNRIDRSKEDGSFVGGIVGRSDQSALLIMTKNDPLIIDEFSSLASEEVLGGSKFVRGGNSENLISGKEYVGGISGFQATISYSINTGKVSALRYAGGVSGSGYRITNSFNTGNVNANNGNLFLNANGDVIFTQATHVGGISGELKGANGTTGTYIQNAFNSSEIVRGASYVGGITGYAVAPIDTVYNSAVVSGKQVSEETAGEAAEIGNKIGGLVGVMAQDAANQIKITNSYNSGQIVATGDMGNLIGFLESSTDELYRTKRVKNAYYLSDDAVRYWDSASSQTNTKINYGLQVLPLNPGFDMGTFVNSTQAIKRDGSIFDAGSDESTKLFDSDLGLRNYTSMIFAYDQVVSTASGSANSATGVANLKNPLNLALIGAAPTNTSTSGTSLSPSGARFKYPFTQSELTIGRDYEFPQLDFSGSGTADQQGMGRVFMQHDPLPGNNQSFSSLDNVSVRNYYNYWPTKMIDYMQVAVKYDNGGSNDNSRYTNGQFVSANDNSPEVRFEANKMPRSAKTNEKIIFEASFTKQVDADGNLILPKFINENVYDGHSRGYYDYKNEFFHVEPLPKAPLKTYTFMNAEEVTEEQEPAQFELVTIGGKDYYFYISGSDKNNALTGDAVFQEIADSITVTETATKITVTMSLPSEEMDSYLAANSGYFTFEGEKVYDADQNVAKEVISTRDRVSRMFSMHFSNDGIISNVADGVELGNTPAIENNSILDEIPNLDLDDLDQTQYATNTAALSSTRLKLASGQVATNPNAIYEEAVRNKLKIANERHLYNLNKNSSMGVAVTGTSYLPYITKESELINNIYLSTDSGYNGFVIGASNGRYYRMPGSLDGNKFTIGNLKVDRVKYPAGTGRAGGFGSDKDMKETHYGFVYELSGGVVKNLFIGSDSKIIAEDVGGLSYMVSNGRTSTDDTNVNNSFFENIGPQLPAERGVAASVYNTTVLAKIQGKNVGGFSLKTVRRFNDSADVSNTAMRSAATFTNSNFGGTINAISGDSFFSSGNAMAASSVKAAGILGFVSGLAHADDIVSSGTTGYFSTSVEINGCSVTKDGYVYAAQIASGILGEAQYASVASRAQNAVIRRSVNNGLIVSSQQANGITQGFEAINPASDSFLEAACVVKSNVNVLYSYNNGVVQTPETTGLASGIGNVLREASYSANNGTVIGGIASGITNYGDRHAVINQNANNGYVQGNQVAGGIVAVAARYNGKAEPIQNIQVRISDSYNTGIVVVKTNNDKAKAIENSYAGGILGYASSPDTIDWKTLNLNSILPTDNRRTIVQSSYNVGRVYYLENGQLSTNNRNVGGIVGGGLNRLVDIKNVYNLSDSEAVAGTVKMAKVANINFANYAAAATNLGLNTIVPPSPADGIGYNYRLTAVGDVPYGTNVTNLSYVDMMRMDNFIGFGNSWVIDRTVDANGHSYPFPQFVARETSPAYVGDTNIGNVPDFQYNVDFNQRTHGVKIDVPAGTINIENITKKKAIPVQIQYSQSAGTATNAFGQSVQTIVDSHYSIRIPNYNSNKDYDIYVLDGDANATNYASALIRKYEIIRGEVRSGGKLHSQVSTSEETLGYFDPNNVSFSGNTLTIKDKESAGWYMPINGYYTVVAMERKEKGVETFPVAPGFWDTIQGWLFGSLPSYATLAGIDKSSLPGLVSERFEVHFGGAESDGSNIRPATGTYDYGTVNKPFTVTDQYGVIGLTTSGIAKGATNGRYYKQTSDIVISDRFYSIFEFNGFYSGSKTTTVKYPNSQPVDQGNYTIHYNMAKQDFGFASYLRTFDPSGTFRATIKDVNFNVKSENDYAMKTGKYLEAANYVVNLGVVSDYTDSAVIDGVTLDGLVEVKGFDPLATRPGYINNAYVFGGVTAFARESEINNTKNNATVGAKASAASYNLPIGNGNATIPYETHSTVNLEVAGIIGLTDNSKLNRVINNGQVISSLSKKAAGIINTMTNNTQATQLSNGGWVKTQSGTAAGLVADMVNGSIKQSYNSGRVSGLAIQGVGSGSAAGLVANLNGGTADQVYNSGIISGRNQGAFTLSSSAKGRITRGFYLKDRGLLWTSSYSLPDYPSMILTDESALSLYSGFSYTPLEIWPFADDTATTYVVTPANPLTGTPAVINDPYALAYKDLSDQSIMSGKGFSFGANNWYMDTVSENPTIPVSGSKLLRDYALDPYRLPQFDQYRHLDRQHENFPIFLGEEHEYGKVPYKGDTNRAQYVPYVTGTDTNETFKDTIMVDLDNVKTTSRYQLLIYKGNADLSRDASNRLIVNPELTIYIERKYVDVRNLSSTDLAIINDPANLQYSKIISDTSGVYYYEIIASDAEGKVRPAIFENKDMFENNTVNVILNNDVLDQLTEPTDSVAPYYSITVLEFQPPEREEETDPNNFYSKFSPHFADAVVGQNDPWDFGTAEKPYQISTQRNLNNLSQGGNSPTPGIESHYLSAHFLQTQDVLLTKQKATVIPNGLAVHTDMWNRGIGTDTIPFSGSYDGASLAVADKRDYVNSSSPLNYSIFNRVGDTGRVSNMNTAIGYQLYSKAPSWLVAENAGVVENVNFASTDATNRTISIDSSVKYFGLAVGRTVQLSTAVPIVKSVNVANSLALQSYMSDANYALGSVVGRTEGNISLIGLSAKSSVTVSDNSSSVKAPAVGGVVGLAIENTFGNQVNLENLQHEGTIKNFLTSGGYPGSVGGILGKAKNANLDISGLRTSGSLQVSSSTNNRNGEVGGLIGFVDNQPDGGNVLLMRGQWEDDGSGRNSTVAANQSISIPKAQSVYAVGGLIGKLTNTTTTLQNVEKKNDISINYAPAASSIGGVVGEVQSSPITLTDSAFNGSIIRDTTSLSADSMRGGAYGGILGRVGNSMVQMLNVNSGRYDTATEASLTRIEVLNSANQDTIVGGMIGYAYASSGQPAPTIELLDSNNNQELTLKNGSASSKLGGIVGALDNYNINLNRVANQGDLISLNTLGSLSGSYVGGLVAYTKQSGFDAKDTDNNGAIRVDSTRGTTVYAGGFLGRADSSRITLTDTDPSKESNVVNNGGLLLNATNPEASNFFAAGAVGYAQNSAIDSTGFRNNGYITTQSTSADSSVRLSGALAFAEGDALANEPSVKLLESLNTGSLTDKRTLAEGVSTSGISVAAGTMGELYNSKTGAQVEYNHNVGTLHAKHVAGILYGISYPSSETEENVAGYLAESSNKFNVNAGDLQAFEKFADASNITPMWQLPAANDGTNDLNGKEAAADLSAIVMYYNAGLEILPEYDPIDPPIESLDSVLLRLPEMQDLGMFKAETGWDGTLIDSATADVDTPWMIGTGNDGTEPIDPQEYTLARLRDNAFTDNGLGGYSNGAPRVLSVASQAVDVAGIGSMDAYLITWQYDGAVNLALDKFTIYLEKDGKILMQLRPSELLLTAQAGNQYTFLLRPEYIAALTNSLEPDASLTADVSVGITRGTGARNVRGLPGGGILLEATEGVPEVSVAMPDGQARALWAPIDYHTLPFNAVGNVVVDYAMTRLGDPYSIVLAGTGRYLDCSYLALMAYRQIGIELPRVASAQAKYVVDRGLTVSRDDLQPGDLVFWSLKQNGEFMNITHVGIYAGNGMVVDASSSRGQVVYRQLYNVENQVVYGRPYATPEFLAQNPGAPTNVPTTAPTEPTVTSETTGVTPVPTATTTTQPTQTAPSTTTGQTTVPTTETSQSSTTTSESKAVEPSSAPPAPAGEVTEVVPGGG